MRRLRAAFRRPAPAIVEQAGSTEPVKQSDPVLLHLFDADYYLEQYPEVAAAGIDPVRHYTEWGRAQHRRPGVLFDPMWYINRNMDVAEKGGDPLEHFLAFGGAEGRDPIPVGFDSAWYLEQHPDVAEQGVNPLIHFVVQGARLGYDPCPDFHLAWYLEHYPDVAAVGANPLVHYLKHGLAEGRWANAEGRSIRSSSDGLVLGGTMNDLLAVPDYLAQRTPWLRPLRMTTGPDVPRVNLVTDGISPDGNFGEVATSLAVAVQWVNATGRRLRIVTRKTAPDGADLADLYSALGIRPDREPQLAFVPYSSANPLEVGADDLFLTTSCWTTTSVLEAVPAARVVYLVQVDERLVNPVGVDVLRATAAMSHPEIQIVVSTEILRRHLLESGLTAMSSAVSFEPSFTNSLRPGRLLAQGKHRELLLDARPGDPHTMFDLGLAVIDAAIEAGDLAGGVWRIHLMGRDLPGLSFADGSLPIVHRLVDWAGYQSLLGEVDLGLALRAATHPSGPLAAVAAGGAVVVTNTFPGLDPVDGVSDRVLWAEPTADDLVRAVCEGMRRVELCASEAFEPLASPYASPWSQNLKQVVDHLAQRFGDV